MARKIILDTYYSFTPSTKTIVIPKPIPKERLILITDVTTNQVIFNFSDTNLTTTSYVIGTDTTGNYPGATTTTIVLSYNTSGLSSTDKLQIVVDEYDEKFSPSETYLDPINKLRVSTPQSLIDTDYEYSVQTTKWEQLGLVNNMPFAYYVTGTGNLGVTNIVANTGSRSYNVNIGSANSVAVGTPVVILDSLYAGADGVYIVDSNNQVTGANTFTYTGKYFYTGANGSIYNPNVTIGYQGGVFSNATISMASASASATGNVVTVVTSQAHNLAIGNEIALTGASTANGSWTVSTVINPTTFQFIGPNGVTPGALTLTNASLYPRPQGLAVHRSFDGGVRFSVNTSSHNQQYIRQTRRYFRYQSGKGIQMSTGTTLKPQLNLDGLTYSSSNNLVIVTTKDPHNINYPAGILISGANEAGYNGTFTSQIVIDPYRFAYTPNVAPTVTQASGPIYGSINSWYGAENRIGIFDQQNGLFWRFDGTQLSVVRRSSVYQVGGLISANPGSTSITSSPGYPTFFSKQLNVNDFIVIKGMSYRVTAILSDQSLTISPAYRGIQALTNATLSKTVDTVIPQSQFNIDRLDGTGPSGYNIDLTKMQMFYIDYSWYGAGFIRWGVRATDGNVIYCHKLINNNQNYLAYMRSGNLPGRYETNTFSKTSFMVGGAAGVGSNFNSVDQALTASNLAGWPTSGTIWVKSSNTGGLGYANSEFISYTGITGNTFTGLTRGQPGNNAILCTTTAGNNIITVTGGNTTTGLQTGQYIFGANVPSQTFVVSNTTTTILMNQAATGTGTSSLFFAPMSNTAQTFLYSPTAQTAIELHSPQVSPEINHWGTSAIMDGGFTNDKSFIFTKGMTNSISVSQGATQAIMSFRISPSASNGIAGSGLGVREIINRMQMLPFEVDTYGNGSFLITCYLNATSNNSSETWQNVGGSSLSQYIFHGSGTTITGGEPVFGFYLNSAQGTYATTQQDLTQLLAIGNSILGGGTSQSAMGIYPNGPDVITFVAQNIDNSSRNIQARYSWNEAQA
jgi:hypothetical protein